MAKALVLEKKGQLSLRDIPVRRDLSPTDVLIGIRTVGVCGSDVHYYTHGKIGPFVVNEPMILGHEAAGVVLEVGSQVRHLKKGDRVCMEPGIPDLSSRSSKLGIYNVDPSVRFWATPPVHGCLTPEVVHPAAFTYRLPDHVSFAEGAMVEPFAIGVQAALRAGIRPGDVGAVMGAGPIGMMTALAALAGGCSKVYVADLAQPKLDVIGADEGIETINVRQQAVSEALAGATGGWGRMSSSSAPEPHPQSLLFRVLRARAEPSCSSACPSNPSPSISSVCRPRNCGSRPCSAMPMSTTALSN